MAEFAEDVEAVQKASSDPTEDASVKIDFSRPTIVKYCGICSMPPEYCEYGSCYDKCLPWIQENCPELLDEELAKLAGKISIEGGEGIETEDKKKKKKGGGAAPPKKATIKETRVVIARVQRQKRKFVTVLGGLETVAGLKIKDAARVFGRKFSSGSSVSEAPGGSKEVVIQGDVCFDLPPLLVSEFKIPESAIFFLEDGTLRPYAG